LRSLWQELKYSFYLVVHPFNGYWEIKHEKRGSLKTAMVLLLFFILTSVADGFYLGYLFSGPDGGVDYNIYKSVAMILLVYILWCITNWCLTSLFDGEGSFYDICVATSYSMVPLILMNVLLIVLSHFLTLNEESMYLLVQGFCYLWFGMLLFLSALVTHQYSFTKTIAIVICTVLGMCIIMYIALLFINLLQQMVSFGAVLYHEWTMRQ